MPKKKKEFILIMAIFALFFIFQKADAKEINSVHLDQDTINKGYTIISSNSHFKLGLPPAAIREETIVTTQLLSKYPSFPKNTRAVSSVYEYNLISDIPPSVHKPFDLSIEYQSGNSSPKAIYYFDQNKNKWLAVPTSISFKSNTVQGKVSLLSARIVVLEKIGFRITLDTETLKKGYTVSDPENSSLKLGIFPDTIDQETQVIIKTASSRPVDIPEELKVVSDSYSFELKTNRPLQFQRPVVLSFKINQPSDHKKQIYYYDGNKGAWLSLPSRGISSDEIRAFIHLPYAKLVVLEDIRYMEEGYASWYRSSRDPYGAASNDYPYGTLLRVSNLANNESVEVKVVSSGPFVQGRIIDLAHLAFQTIADLYLDGVIRVRVEEV